jgi:cytochrome c-type biogenesis protein CcmE
VDVDAVDPVDPAGDAGPALDLSPRPPRPPRRRSPLAIAVLGVVLLAAGFVLFNGLRSASLYYYNADEAVAKRASLDDHRFRIQGTVQEGVAQSGDAVDFTIAFNDVKVAVHHVGDPPELFKPGIPVVLEGRWQAGTNPPVFDSDRILIKHSAQYRAKHPDRVTNAPQ